MSTSEDSSRRSNGRYRFRAGNPLDPNGGDPAELSPSFADSSPIPDTAEALIAMQQRHQVHPEKPGSELQRQRATPFVSVVGL